MIDYKKLVEIEKNILEDVEKEFTIIKKELYFFLDQDFDLYFLKEFIKHYPPKIVRERAEILLETLLNYFMKDLIDFIRTLDTDKQYLFFRENIRDKIKQIALNNLNSIIPHTLSIKEEKAIEKTIPIVGSIALASGGIVTAIILPESLLLKSIPAGSSILTSLYLMKFYRDRNKRLKKKWKKLVNEFLDKNKKTIIDWLNECKKNIVYEINNFYQIIINNDKVSTQLLEPRLSAKTLFCPLIISLKLFL